MQSKAAPINPLVPSIGGAHNLMLTRDPMQRSCANCFVLKNTARDPACTDLLSAVLNDVTERPQSFIYKPRIRKDVRNVRVENYHDGVLCKPVCVFPANAARKVATRAASLRVVV